MKSFFKRKPYMIMGVGGMLLWFTETWYFGWNETAQSGAERVLDLISSIMMIWGMFGDIVSTLYVVKISSPYPVEQNTYTVINGKVTKETHN